MARNFLIGLVVIVVAVAGFLYYQEQKDDVRIELPGGGNDVTIDR